MLQMPEVPTANPTGETFQPLRLRLRGLEREHEFWAKSYNMNRDLGSQEGMAYASAQQIWLEEAIRAIQTELLIPPYPAENPLREE